MGKQNSKFYHQKFCAICKKNIGENSEIQIIYKGDICEKWHYEKLFICKQKFLHSDHCMESSSFAIQNFSRIFLALVS